MVSPTKQSWDCFDEHLLAIDVRESQQPRNPTESVSYSLNQEGLKISLGLMLGPLWGLIIIVQIIPLNTLILGSTTPLSPLVRPNLHLDPH